MKLIAYVRPGHRLNIRPAPVDRHWMDITVDQFAYRCLPLNIANSHGWEILCLAGFKARWNGGREVSAVEVFPEGTALHAFSHFGSGVLTLSVPCVFVTDPGTDLFVQGPINRPKDGISALSAVVETDWLPFTFTMNWKFTRPDTEIAFEKGEPFCHIFPVRRGSLEGVDPEMQELSADPILEERNRMWSESRNDFNRRLKEGPRQPLSMNWQKHYFQGREPDGTQNSLQGHRTKLLLKPFASRTSVESPRESAPGQSPQDGGGSE